MATYYRWRQSTIGTIDETTKITHIALSRNKTYKTAQSVSIDVDTLTYIFTSEKTYNGQPYPGVTLSKGTIIYGYPYDNESYVEITGNNATVYTNPESSNQIVLDSPGGSALRHRNPGIIAGEFQEYVYSLSASAYPNGGVQGDYYYDQRTTITSPTAPTGLRYPNPIVTSSSTVSWTAAQSNTDYPVNLYELSYSTNGGGSWTVAGTTESTSLSVPLPAGATFILYRVRAQDSNGQWSGYATGTVSNVLATPTISVPSQAMQGQNIPVSWTAVDGATGYTLQRKADTDIDWVEVYTGQDLEFSEEVGAWSTVQYRVQAVFSVGPGGWGTSKVIPVVSASALVISGQDGYLGTLTADVPYTVSTDTGKPITVERKVNGQVVASIEASSNFAYDIPIYDLPTGAGTITLTCSVTPEGQAPVQAERKWTYYKAPALFPQTGSTAQITKEGENIYTLTIAEAVKVPTNWGGSLDKALEMLLPVVSAAVISVGTYEGTGTFGVDNPNTLTLDDEPLVVTVYGDGRTLVISSTEASAPAHISGSQAKWYSTESAAEQMNSDGVTYSFVAVAKGVQA